jgi:uncharacterized membrane protein YphA (DoxX/SURF4 family)
MKPVRTPAHALLGAIFVTGGTQALANPEQLIPPAKRVTDRVVPLLEKIHPRLPTDARSLVRLTGATQLVGGLLLVTGHLTRPAAAMLAGSLIPTTLAGHPFWTADDPVRRRGMQEHFFKNVGLLGGLLLALADTQGQPSLRWRTGHFIDDRRRAVRRTTQTVRREARIAVRAANAGRRLPG